jgi:hypothetical protein
MTEILDRLDAIEERLGRLERGLFHLIPTGPIDVQPAIPNQMVEPDEALVAEIKEAIRNIAKEPTE